MLLCSVPVLGSSFVEYQRIPCRSIFQVLTHLGHCSKLVRYQPTTYQHKPSMGKYQYKDLKFKVAQESSLRLSIFSLGLLVYNDNRSFTMYKKLFQRCHLRVPCLGVWEGDCFLGGSREENWERKKEFQRFSDIFIFALRKFCPTLRLVGIKIQLAGFITIAWTFQSK